jgi:hypothetical protein
VEKNSKLCTGWTRTSSGIPGMTFSTGPGPYLERPVKLAPDLRRVAKPQDKPVARPAHPLHGPGHWDLVDGGLPPHRIKGDHKLDPVLQAPMVNAAQRK